VRFPTRFEPFLASTGRPSLSSSTTVLEVRNLKTQFLTDDGIVKAVDDVSFSLGTGKTLGLVGESGSGKSVTALSIARLIDRPGQIVGGEILLEGQDVLSLPESEMRRLRGRKVAMIFQEPMTALNPVLTIGYQIAESVLAHETVSKAEAWNRAVDAMKSVSIPDAGRRAKDYPHQLSGGMRQRVMIAMALVSNPTLLIADEPTTALDVTIQAQILELLAELRERYHLSLMLISHDLGVIAEVSDSVAVMYAGKIVETGPADKVFEEARHPYTQGLLRSIPKLGSSIDKKQRLEVIEGVVPSLLNLPPGCAFAPRCDKRTEECSAGPIGLDTVGDGHYARCIHA
jgi:peptide/nickel transport system ATP-binding protein